MKCYFEARVYEDQFFKRSITTRADGFSGVTEPQGNRFISDSVCTFAGHRVVSHAVTIRIGDNALHTEGTTIIDAKWLGPCKAGQKPADIMMER